MIRGKYLRERKAIRVKRRCKFLIVLAIILTIYRILSDSYSLFESEASSAAEIDVAFFAVEDNYESNLINLGDFEPGHSEEYLFSVANYITKDGETYIAETNIDYTLTIRATTNLPLEYELYIGESSELGENKAKNDDINQDEDNTYFKKIIEDTGTFELNKKAIKTYKLVITYPDDEQYKSVDYQNIIECVEISVDSHQKVD